MVPDPLSATFAALADPTRRAILARLAAGDASVTALAKPFDMSMPAISKHLKVLQRAGLVTRSRNAQWRPCQLEAGPMQQAADWLAFYRQFWEQSLDRLQDYLVELQTREEPDARPSGPTATRTSRQPGQKPASTKSRKPTSSKSRKPTSSKSRKPA